MKEKPTGSLRVAMNCEIQLLCSYVSNVMQELLIRPLWIHLFDGGPRERQRRGGWNFLLKALRTHLCYGTRQTLQGQRIKAREKNKKRNKNWKKRKGGTQGQRQGETLEEHSRMC